MTHWKALRYSKDDWRGLGCGSTLNIHQDVFISGNLLHKWGFVDSQFCTSVSKTVLKWTFMRGKYAINSFPTLNLAHWPAPLPKPNTILLKYEEKCLLECNVALAHPPKPSSMLETYLGKAWLIIHSHGFQLMMNSLCINGAFDILAQP